MEEYHEHEGVLGVGLVEQPKTSKLRSHLGSLSKEIEVEEPRETYQFT
jgi:hypothetical protein